MSVKKEDNQIVETAAPQYLEGTKQKILEEDDYLNRMAKIIKRDFFLVPTDDTPSVSVQFDRTDTPGTSRTNYTATSSVRSRKESCNLSLDEFLDKYTSEDNAYFELLKRKDLKRHRAKYPWLYKDIDNHNTKVNEQLRLPSSSNQSKLTPSSTEAKPMIDWPYNPKNALFYPTDQDELRSKRSTVNYGSTKYMKAPIFKESSSDNMAEKSTGNDRFPNKVGIDGRVLSDTEPSSTSNYSFMPPPQSPMLPRVESDHIEIKVEPKTKYFIPSESPRDDLARRLYEEKVAKKIRTPKTATRMDGTHSGPHTKDSFSKWRL